jgi:hypothetical protein
LISFRKTLRSVHGLPVRTEIHAAEFIGSRIQAVLFAASHPTGNLA